MTIQKFNFTNLSCKIIHKMYFLVCKFVIDTWRC